jgi:hypothetical protein
MNIPRGNVLLKPTSLSGEDVKLKLTNLQNHGFNGYIKITVNERTSFVFMREGITSSVVEISGKNISLAAELLLHHYLRKETPIVASYVLAPETASVLSGSHAFQEKYLNSPIRKREFRKLLGNLDGERITGMIEIVGSSSEDAVFLLLNQGRIITDNFLDAYGQIITGPEKVNELIESLSVQGGVVNVFGEKPDEIEKKKQLKEETFAQYRELMISVESGGFLGGGNTVKVDETLLKEWSKTRPIQKLALYVGSETPEIYKVSGKKGIGGKIVMSATIQKKIKAAKDAYILVSPENG